MNRVHAPRLGGNPPPGRGFPARKAGAARKGDSPAVAGFRRLARPLLWIRLEWAVPWRSRWSPGPGTTLGWDPTGAVEGAGGSGGGAVRGGAGDALVDLGLGRGTRGAADDDADSARPRWDRAGGAGRGDPRRAAALALRAERARLGRAGSSARSRSRRGAAAVGGVEGGYYLRDFGKFLGTSHPPDRAPPPSPNPTPRKAGHGTRSGRRRSRPT